MWQFYSNNSLSTNNFLIHMHVSVTLPHVKNDSLMKYKSEVFNESNIILSNYHQIPMECIVSYMS